MITRLLALVLLCSCLLSCHIDLKLDKEKAISLLPQLKDGEAKAIIQFDHKSFYLPESIFTGNVILGKKTFSTNLFNQFEGNFAFKFQVNNWKNPKPIITEVDSININGFDTSILIGRILDKKEHTGEGYVMTEGEIKIEELSKNICIILFKGKLARYSSAVNKPKLWKTFTGLVVWKKPTFIIEDDIKAEQLFF